MNFNELEIDTFGQISLTQKKFRDGALIVSGMRKNEEYVAIDVRFYLEKEDGWLPTKTGFWVAKENWRALKKVLSRSPETIGEVICWRSKTRKFIVRYIPNYGGGIDFRYFQESATYTGWEKKGIRIAQKDFNKVKKIIQASITAPEKCVINKPVNVIHANKKKKHSYDLTESYSIDSQSINQALMEILAS